jgi:hypothetical protein
VSRRQPYPRIQFPWPPWTLTAYLQLTQAQARGWAEWLNETEPGRHSVITSFLLEEGVHPPGRELQEWAALGSWIYHWFPVIAAPYVDRRDASSPQGFFQDAPDYRLGWAWAASIASDHGYSPDADALLHSLAVDLAFLVTTAARADRPGLRWRTGLDDGGFDFFLTPDSTGEPFALIRRIRDFLVQSVARPRGTGGQRLRRWRSGELHRCYQSTATGNVQDPEWKQFPGSNQGRHGSRYILVEPPGAGPEPRPEVLAAVTAFRRAGWFGKSKLPDAGLARAVMATWRAYEEEEIPSTADEINWRLLVLDGDRTWSEDVDAAARPGENVHEGTLWAISRVIGKALRSLRDPEEAWAAPDEDVQLSFELGRRHCRLRLPAPRQYLSPALITGINELLPDSSPRLWFAGSRAPIAIVTVATAAERDTLRQLAGVTLSQAPPDWWTGLAPLSAPGEGT